MYNDGIEILLCVFAVYGAYALIRELWMLLPHRDRFVIAARLENAADWELQRDRIAVAEHAARRISAAERAPILLVDREISLENLQDVNYTVYQKITDTEDLCRRQSKIK